MHIHRFTKLVSMRGPRREGKFAAYVYACRCGKTTEKTK